MKKFNIILFVFVINFSSYAQYGRINKPPKSDKIFKQMNKQRSKQMKKENKDRTKDLISSLKEFSDKNVTPQMKIWKECIDSALSPNDKIFVDSLRFLSAQIIQDSKQVKKDKSKAEKFYNDEKIEQNNKILKDNKKQSKEIDKSLKEVFNDYKKLFDPLKSEAKLKAEFWEKDASEMAIKWISESGYNLSDKEKKKIETYWKYTLIINLNRITLWNGRSELFSK